MSLKRRSLLLAGFAFVAAPALAKFSSTEGYLITEGTSAYTTLHLYGPYYTYREVNDLISFAQKNVLGGTLTMGTPKVISEIVLRYEANESIVVPKDFVLKFGDVA